MHEGQVNVSAEVVRQLVADQLPQWSTDDVRPLASDGTVNALFRLGEDVVLRFPLQPKADDSGRDSLVREQEHATLIGPRVLLQVPEPLALGRPGEGYAGWWTAYRWIEGSPPNDSDLDDRFAHDLAGFVRELRDINTGGLGWDGRSRGGPLVVRDAGVRAALAQSSRLVDVPAVSQVWDECLAADPYRGPGVWLHADLMPGNLLVRGGRLAAVIDLGAVCVGDPAVDLMPAWNLLDAAARRAYREALGDDGDTWLRGRGWALTQAIVALPYYIDTNRAMADTALRTLAALAEDVLA